MAWRTASRETVCKAFRLRRTREAEITIELVSRVSWCSCSTFVFNDSPSEGGFGPLSLRCFFLSAVVIVPKPDSSGWMSETQLQRAASVRPVAGRGAAARFCPYCRKPGGAFLFNAPCVSSVPDRPRFPLQAAEVSPGRLALQRGSVPNLALSGRINRGHGHKLPEAACRAPGRFLADRTGWPVPGRRIPDDAFQATGECERWSADIRADAGDVSCLRFALPCRSSAAHLSASRGSTHQYKTYSWIAS